MFSTATVVVAMTGAVVLCIVAPTFLSITVGIAAEVVFDDDDNDDVPVIGKFTRTEIEQAFGLKHNSLIVPTNDNDDNNNNNNNNTATSTTTTMTLFDVLANQNAWTPYENWPLQLDHLNSLLDPATAGGQYLLDVVSQTYTPNMFHLLEGGHEYDEYVFLAGDTVPVLHIRYKVVAYINETTRITTVLDEKGVPNTNDISNLVLTQFVENCSTPIDSEVVVGWYLTGPNYGPYEGYKGYNGTSMADPNRNLGRMVVSGNHVDLTATLPIDNTTSWSQWILEHRDEYKKPFGEAPICASTECGKFEVICDEIIEALGVNCELGSCIDCTPSLQKKGVNCATNPFTFGRPDDFTLINELAFPNWCLKGGSGADAEERVSCNDAAKGEENGQINPNLFNPIYLTKKHSGAAPEKGGYPTNTDTQYVYEFAGPFLGQAGGGTSDQCPEDFDGTRLNFKQCGKLNTLDDRGPYGPGHVPPHIATAAIKFALAGTGNGVSALMGPAVPDETWFDFPTTGCRIQTSILFDCLRTFYSRVEGEVVKYPPPFTAEGGDYKLEFVNKVGDSCDSEKEKFPTTICFEEHSGGGPGDYPDYIKQGGGPHYCSKSAVEADANDGWCPYLFFGPNRGQYRHPHIAYAALETYIAHQVIPDKCGTAWDDRRYPAAMDTTVAWPVETEVDVLTNNQVDFEPNTLFSPNQPKTRRRRVGSKSSKNHKGKLTFVWPDDNGFQKKPVIGQFANNKFVGAAE